jgi:hemolysin activation/secretion protein
VIASNMPNRRNGLAVLSLALVLSAGVWSSVPAQLLPAGATPGGVLPRISQATQSPAEPAELFSIPRVSERPLGVDEGPRLIVRAFRLSGAVDRPERDLAVADAQALLDAARTSQPAEGYTVNQLQEVATKVADHYRKRGFILAQAFVPAQEVRDGEVTVQVLEGKLGQITVEGNKSYSADRLLRPFNALVGGPVDRDTIESALLTLTNYPGVTAFGVLGAGADIGTTNLTLRVQGEDRVEFGTSVDNYGSQFAGEYRGQFGMTVNNLFGAADRLTLFGLYAFDDSDSDAKGLYGGINYEVPLFSPRDAVRFSYATNSYDVGAAAADLAATGSEGDTSIAEIGYRHDFAPSRFGSASFGLAFNVKSAEFRASATDVFQDDLTTSRLDLAWDRIDTRFRGVNRIALSYTHGFDDLLDSLGEYDGNAQVRASRRGASGKFDKLMLVLQRRQTLTRHSALLLRFVAQESSDPLVSLEQFSLAGPDAVRAYPVAELLAEKGQMATLEWTVGAPGFAGKPAFAGRTWGQVLQFSLFADYAHGELNEPLVGSQDGTTDLAGWGGAIQFDVPGRVFARLDVSTPITDRLPSNDRDPQYFFRFGVSF